MVGQERGGDSSAFTVPFMVISRHVQANVNGKPFASTEEYSHSSFLRTMQEIFTVDPTHGFNWLGAAASATDLAAMFKPGVIR